MATISGSERIDIASTRWSDRISNSPQSDEDRLPGFRGWGQVKSGPYSWVAGDVAGDIEKRIWDHHLAVLPPRSDGRLSLYTTSHRAVAAAMMTRSGAP